MEPHETPSGLAVFHFDFYRFSDPAEWEDAGLRDAFAAPALKLDALDFVADLVGYLPSNNREFAPISDFEPEEGSLEENMNPDDLRLDSIIPNSPTVPYDVREVIESVTDDGEYLEIQADRARPQRF